MKGDESKCLDLKWDLSLADALLTGRTPDLACP